MSGSNWSERHKVGLICGIVFAAFISTITIGWGLSESANYQRQANYHASEHEKYTGDKVAKTCVRLPPIEKFECLGDAIDAQRTYEREEQDLVAQRQNALWAYIMASAAVVGMGLSIVGVILVYVTFSETRESNSIARQAANNAANEAKEARNALILVQRAVIRIIRIRVSSAERDGWMEVTFDVQNDGQSNAHRFRIDYSVVDEPVYPEALNFSQPISVMLTPNRRADFPNFAMRIPDRFPSYMMGALSYATVYGVIFETFFCMEIEGLPYQDQLGQMRNIILNPTFCPSMPRDS